MIAYLVTCLVTGKRYVGITSRSLKKRWAEHLYDSRQNRCRMAIGRAITKYGAENFSIEPLCCAEAWKDICAAEIILIGQWQTMKPAGYNISTGGYGPFGVKKSAESIERSAAKHRGRPCHPNTRAAASAFHRGRQKSAETRAKMSAASKGHVVSSEGRLKISIARTGKSANAGETNHWALLAADKVRAIRRLLAEGSRQRHLAEQFGVSVTTIWKVAHGLSWSSVV